jgi:ELWxxDGT repeat protein
MNARFAAFALAVSLTVGSASAQTTLTDLTTADSLTGLGQRSGVTMGGVLYFPWCAFEGCELWRTDGTTAGTRIVRDIEAGTGSSSPSGLVAIGSTLYFAAYDTTNGRELWKSDGTSAGTVLVRNINTASGASSSPSQLVALGSTLIFAAYESSATGIELFSSNGTSAGTTRVADIYQGGTSSAPEELTAVGGFVYFSAEHPTYGRELFRTNGTQAGTVIVSDLVPGVGWSDPRHLTTIGSTLFFAAHTATTGNELFRTDGLSSQLVRDINPGTGSADPSGLTVIGSTLFFSARDAVAGQELWRSDGTDLGTSLVRDIRPGGAGSYPRDLTASGPLLFLAADDGTAGSELWRSDGTTAGTSLVKDVWTGAGSSSPSRIVATGNGVAFAARGTEGSGLYRSNGTSDGTGLITATLAATFGEIDRLAPLGTGLVVSSFASTGPLGRLAFLADPGLLALSLSVSSSSIAEGSTGDSLLAFNVTLSAAAPFDVTFNYSTSNGTATAGVDYSGSSGTFTIPQGYSSKALVISVQGDATAEADETLTVTFSNAGTVAIANPTVTGTIVNDDPAGTATTVTQYRLYHDGTKEHLYTTDANEYAVLGTRGWAQEGVAYRMLTNGFYNGVATIPLFRLYHPGIQQHHWTTDPNEAKTLGGWTSWFYESTIGYLLPTQVAGTVPLYRMSLTYPPLHIWTTDLNEYDTLATRGWTKEGIIGYVVP